MRVLGIDTSLTGTGLARIDLASWPPSNPPRQPDEPVAFTADTAIVSAPKPTKDKSKRAMARRVNDLIDQIEGCFRDDEKPDAVGMEGLAYGAKGSGVWVLPWVFGRVVELCEKYDVPLTIVATSQRAKFATGNGNASKDAVLLATSRLFNGVVDIIDNNDADALIVGAAVCQRMGLPILPVTKYRNDVVAALED
ncbi:RuvC-like Holliday junction resolvase [Mycobacterium phage Vincenzo]|uniref:RuvC-like resolvase n=2 Tax=Coopervirus vincenzo TaxID=1983110 RepID=A0A0F6YQE2_9CAUD|nr:RuvC-like Holliday junction resolvase [Mycobacterium phage Vincenzo]AKF14270.1 RuvC-like resolvase [Mycobacterium phage Vincenzo]AKF14673.1 RuvC-like resolvase [Mycobacterium phage AlanGrant]